MAVTSRGPWVFGADVRIDLVAVLAFGVALVIGLIGGLR
jgi:hypothetical protein